MSTFPTPPEDTTGPGDDRNPTRPITRRRPSVHHRPDADFELMLLLRGASRALELRNRVVRVRRSGAAARRVPAPEPDPPRDPAHPA
jgi:hypothetical protein